MCPRERHPGDRGRAFGRAQRSGVQATVDFYRRFLGEVSGLDEHELGVFGAAVGARISAEWPDLVDEVEGIAAGARVPSALLLAVNARTELLAGTAELECSLVGRLEDDAVWLAQNWDWHPDLRGARVIWKVAADDGRFVTATEAGILGKIGLNGSGLAVGLNFLSSSLDRRRDGLPVHVLLRVLLDRCTTATDAFELLLNADVSASACITVAAVEPEGATLAAVELSPGGVTIAWPGADGRLAHTNHFVDGPRRGQDLTPAQYPSTLLRLQHLERRGTATGAPEDALRSHYPRPHPVCRHASEADDWSERRETLFSVILEPASGRMRISDGPPCSAPYEPVVA